MTGSAAARGKDLDEAVRLAVDEINSTGGVNGHTIKMVLYDDGDLPDRARSLAMQVASGPALAVLGQVASSAGIAAGEVYKQQKIPAITGAASQSTVTAGNDWFFRLLPDAAGQGEFLADYARYRYQARAIAVIREKGTAGEEFASALRDRAKEDGIRVVKDLEFLPAEAKDRSVLEDLAKKLAPLPKGEIIVFGTQYAETPAVLRVFRDKLGAFTSMGYSSLATDGLSDRFREDEAAMHAPGHYTDGFTVAAPQLPDIAEYAQTVFAAKFRSRYRKEANPEAVRWYEAALLVFQAMSSTNITGNDRALARRQIRDWLAGLDRPEAAIGGVGGPIYFDKNHNVQRAMSVGVFYSGHLVSAPIQFTPVADPEGVPGWERLRSSGMVIDVGGNKVVKTPVVYAGIELNSLDNIDVRTGTFAADFFLWFRSQDDQTLDPHEVEFPTLASGGQLGQEVFRRSRGGFTTVAYHVKGVFKAEYEFSRFPFDEQSLKIPVQYRNSSSYSLILAYGGIASHENANENTKRADAGTRQEGVALASDNVGGASNTKGGSGKQHHVAHSPLVNKLWKLKSQIFYRDVVAYQSSFGEDVGSQKGEVELNRINSDTTIQRDVFGFAVKNFLPLACILVALIIGYSLAPDVINPRVSIGVTALLTTSVLYQKMASDLPTVTYITAIDYVFFAFFGICVLFLALTVVTYETHRAKMHKPTKILNHSGTALTLAGLGGTLIFVWVRYWGHA
jgi:ABC-type branched-subunit amino acid transport system substrate-binding protein